MFSLMLYYPGSFCFCRHMQYASINCLGNPFTAEENLRNKKLTYSLWKISSEICFPSLPYVAL